MREIDIPSARAERAHKPRRARRTTFGLFYANRSQYRARARFVPSNPQGLRARFRQATLIPPRVLAYHMASQLLFPFTRSRRTLGWRTHQGFSRRLSLGRAK